MGSGDCVCDSVCIYKCLDLIFVLGLIANIIVVWRTAVDKALKSPTFVAIACLAFSDAVFLAVNMTTASIIVKSMLSCTSFAFMFTDEVEAIIGVWWFVSSAHLTLISVVRCILILYPLKAHVYLTRRKVIIASVLLWTTGSIIWSVLYMLQHFKVVLTTKSVEFQIAVWLTVFFTPVVIMMVVHILKCRAVQRSSVSISSSDTRRMNQSQQMAKMILLLVVLSLVLPLPRFIITVLLYSGVEFSKNAQRHLRSISHLLFLLNNSANPVLYAFISVNFRRSMQRFRSSFRRSLSFASSSESSIIERGTSAKSVCQISTSQDDKIKSATETYSAVIKSPNDEESALENTVEKKESDINGDIQYSNASYEEEEKNADNYPECNTCHEENNKNDMLDTSVEKAPTTHVGYQRENTESGVPEEKSEQGIEDYLGVLDDKENEINRATETDSYSASVEKAPTTYVGNQENTESGVPEEKSEQGIEDCLVVSDDKQNEINGAPETDSSSASVEKAPTTYVGNQRDNTESGVPEEKSEQGIEDCSGEGTGGLNDKENEINGAPETDASIAKRQY